MKEIEVKILEIDKKEVEKKLKSLGAKKIFDGILQAHFYDFPNKSIHKAQNLFRLRKENNKVFLTYKEFITKNKVKIFEEHEVEVSNFITTHNMLLALGLNKKRETKKHRRSYILNGAHIEIETYQEKNSNIPPFLEIEAHNLKAIYSIAKKMGYTTTDCKPWGFGELEKYYRTRKS